MNTNNKLNGYDLHNIVTLDGKFTYERPVSFERVNTANGGWWGVATFADGQVLKKFMGKPARIVPVASK